MLYLLYLKHIANLPALFGYISFRGISAALTSFIIVILLTPLFIKISKKNRLGDVIRDDGPISHKSKKGTPTMGGIIFAFAAIFSSLLWSNITNRFVLILIFTTLFGASLGFIDDYLKIKRNNSNGLKAKTRLAVEILFAILVIYIIHIIYMSNHFLYSTNLFFPITKLTVNLGMFYFVFASFVIVGSANAVNLTDGLDGLATGLSLIIMIVFILASYLAGNLDFATYLKIPHIIGAGEISVYLSAFFGSLLGFLWYNCYPAEIFMGDTGSLAIGTVMGVTAVMIKDEILLAIAGAVFVIETVSVILQVSNFKLTKKRIFMMTPIHHHFELKGWKEPKIIIRFWIMGLIVAIFSLILFKIR